ncbi:hypothetical protein C9374_002607 [Naegleria lovaniensis]|uniref:Uncharacterized protein n=1 Tax=Naegleria lovaniensis TaxID=51637 RepID=A0AA88GPV2_NAELO|nr:uncharacterized protein C9374_002607 [Naegleria lovaniensis]KAG2386161.1 hypothetical protein C9374_002607 [Naegleria lovaniensis]
MTEFDSFNVPSISLEQEDDHGYVHSHSLSFPIVNLGQIAAENNLGFGLAMVHSQNHGLCEDDALKAMLYEATTRGDLKSVQNHLMEMEKQYRLSVENGTLSASSSTTTTTTSLIFNSMSSSHDFRHIVLTTTFPDHHDCTLIHAAAKYNQVEMLQWLLTGDIAKCSSQSTVTSNVSDENSVEADSGKSSSSQQHSAFTSPRSSIQAQLLSTKDNHDATPIFYACQTSAHDACAYLCSFKVVQEQLNTSHDRYGYLPLYISLKKKDYELCDLLQLFGAKIDVLIGNSETFLHHAVREKDLQMVEYIAKIKPSLLLRKNQREENPLFSCLSDGRGGRKRKKRAEISAATNSDLDFLDVADKFGSMFSETSDSYLLGNGSEGSAQSSLTLGSLSSSIHTPQYANSTSTLALVSVDHSHEDDKLFVSTFLFKGTMIFGVETFEKAFLQKNAFGRNIIMECAVLNDIKAMNHLFAFLKDYCTNSSSDRFITLLLTETDQQHRNILHLAVDTCAKQAGSWISRHLVQLETMSDRPVDRSSMSSLFSSRSAVSNVEIETFITHQRWISCLETVLDFLEYCSNYTTSSLSGLFYVKDRMDCIPEEKSKETLKEFQVGSGNAQQVQQNISNTIQNAVKQIKSVERRKLKPKAKTGSFSWRKSQRSTNNIFEQSPEGVPAVRHSVIDTSPHHKKKNIQMNKSAAAADDLDVDHNRHSMLSPLSVDSHGGDKSATTTSSKLKKLKAAFLKRLNK